MESEVFQDLTAEMRDIGQTAKTLSAALLEHNSHMGVVKGALGEISQLLNTLVQLYSKAATAETDMRAQALYLMREELELKQNPAKVLANLQDAIPKMKDLLIQVLFTPEDETTNPPDAIPPEGITTEMEPSSDPSASASEPAPAPRSELVDGVLVHKEGQ